MKIPVQLVLSAVETIETLVGLSSVSATALNTAVNAIIVWVPILIADFPDLVQRVQDATSIIMGGKDLTADQMKALTKAADDLEAEGARIDAINGTQGA